MATKKKMPPWLNKGKGDTENAADARSGTKEDMAEMTPAMKKKRAKKQAISMTMMRMKGGAGK